MDLTEAFRSEDISKTDFFDFVVAPDASENQQTLNFNRTLKSMGIFIDNPNDHNNSNSNGTAEFQETKEETNNNNNNHLMMTNDMNETIGISNVVGNFVDHPFWSTTCDKETVRLETAILEDLNKFCWNQEPDIAVNNNAGGGGVASDKDPLVSAANNNTDGAIYTLTVLNGDHGTATWYRTPEPIQIKEEDCTRHSPHDLDHLDNPQQSSLDLDSILSIIPNHSQNGHHYQQQQQQQNGFQTSISSHLDNEHMKSEYTYDDSGYATKDSGGCHVGENTHLIESDTNFNNNNNNNDWKLSNNNNNSTSSADSLLRSALQGKSFLGRYNGPKNGIKVLDGHTELRRALSTPPNGSKTPLDQSPVFIGSEEDMEMKHHSPLLVMDQNSIIYDDARVLGIVDSDNPSSTHSMDDILLSQLDAVSYPEDYEKLKRIANEVAESVGHYCNLDPVGSPQSIYLNAHDLGISTNHAALSPATSTNKGSNSKKLNKKQTNGTRAVHNSPVQSNGVRKERSLHYCSICSKGFKDKYSVNVHIRTHTGEKPFACSLCGKSFRQKAHLAKHYQTHIAQKNAAANNNGVAKSGNKRFASAKSS